MKQRVFGEEIHARDVEELPAETGPTAFVRLCGLLIGRALADRLGSFTLPQLSERVLAPDGGVDAEYVAPEGVDLPETGGLVGPGTTVFQFKYRDMTRAGRAAIRRELRHRLRTDLSRVAPACDRYVLMTNLDLTSADSRRLREATEAASPTFIGKTVVVLGAAEIALALNLTPQLRHLFYVPGGLCTLDFAEEELKAAYAQAAWPAFRNREAQIAAIRRFVDDSSSRVLQVVGAPYVGKTRMVIEALRSVGGRVLWAAEPEHVSLDLFRDLDAADESVFLAVDRCEESSLRRVLELARARRHVKTVVIRNGSHAEASEHILFVAPLDDRETVRMIEDIAPGLPSLRQSWVRRVTHGVPGLVVDVVALLESARLSGSESPEDVQRRMGELLEEAYLLSMDAAERQALEVASILAAVGVAGEVSREVDAVCRAVRVPLGTFSQHLPALERAGLVHWRGRFIEMSPPRLAEHVAARVVATVGAERLLAELALALDGPAFGRFLSRFRNVAREEVRVAVEGIFSSGGWFPDLDALMARAEVVEVLAPAAPPAALRCLERLLGSLGPEELAARVTERARRSVVTALEDLALRPETFAGAARLLASLAEAENETWANNATGVFISLFHWQNPEVPAPVRQRLGALIAEAGSSSPTRRRIMAGACARAFDEHAVVCLHEAKGSTVPSVPSRPGTWEEVREYGQGVLDVLASLATDHDPEVREAAIGGLLGSVRPFVRYSLTGEGFHVLGDSALRVLKEVGETVPARLWSRAISQLEVLLEDLSVPALASSTAAGQARQRVRDVLEALTEGNLRRELWRWIGPRSFSLEAKPDGGPEIEKQIRAIARRLVEDPEAFEQHIDWLISDEAEHRARLFQVLGEEDRDRRLWERLLSRGGQPAWRQVLSAYVLGGASVDPQGAQSALEHVLGSRTDLVPEALAAMFSALPSTRAVELVAQALRDARITHGLVASDVLPSLGPEGLSDGDFQRLVQAVDDGTTAVRSLLLWPIERRLVRQRSLTPALRELAWRLLESTVETVERIPRRDWDGLAATLGGGEPERLLQLAATVLPAWTDRRASPPSEALPLTWKALKSTQRQGLAGILLRFAMRSDASHWVEWELAPMIRPVEDRELIREFTVETGVEGAAMVTRYLDPDDGGFWAVAIDLLRAFGDDERVRRRMISRLWTGSSWGSAVPMIEKRLGAVRSLLAHPDGHVSRWASDAVSALEEWRQRAGREDREDWIWDCPISRAEFEGMLARRGSPERWWAIGRLLKDAPKERVFELLTPEEIVEALPEIRHLDRETRRQWDAYTRFASRHH